MNEDTTALQTQPALPEFLSGGGHTGAIIRSLDWLQTALGAPALWPQSLRTSVSICLSSNFPICIYWGPELVLIYNDAWSSIPGGKHPWSLGKTGRQVWPEIWNEIEAWFTDAFAGKPVGSTDQLLFMDRHGYAEECFFDFTFTPIYGDSGKVEGIFNAVIETTYRVINERRNVLLQQLHKRINQASTLNAVCTETVAVLREDKKDVPFSAIYFLQNNQACLKAADFELAEGQRKFTLGGEPADPFAQLVQAFVRDPKPQVVKGIGGMIENLPTGFWPEPTTEALLVPFFSAAGEVSGFLLAGISPRRILDGEYQLFFENVASTVSNEVNNILSFQEERKRAEALAEIDKAKTAFFTNISHEFRTPLTLMLGTVEEAISDPETSPLTAERMTITRRSAMRLLKLVNTLLDFSRLEAGRARAHYEPTDVASFTADIASSFRSAIEAAGLQFTVQCHEVPQPVYLDRDMWEKIVLNLLSNAFKYTLHGSITLTLDTVPFSPAADRNNTPAATGGTGVRLMVSDTGVGIPENELPKMFQRFHRVQNTGGRTHEGTGIGLSLVKELVTLHGGHISVTSTHGEGSVFTVVIPAGKAQAATDSGTGGSTFNETLAKPFLEEASLLVESLRSANGNSASAAPSAPAVLVVDDNADMRKYIQGLLQKQFRVYTANNGLEALRLLHQQRVDLVLSDVMMPVMDGIDMLQRIKQNMQTAALPVILVSARAGEEARIEGLNVGADDYLVKPFSAKELVARVASQIALSEQRSQTLQNVYRLFDEVPFGVAALKGPEMVVEYVNQYCLHIWQQRKEDVLGKPLMQTGLSPGMAAQAIYEQVYSTGQRFEAKERLLAAPDGDKQNSRYFDVVIAPVRTEEGITTGQLATFIDVTEKVQARTKIEESEKALSEMANAMPQLVWVADADGTVRFYNNRVQEFKGARQLPDGRWYWEGMVHPDDLDLTKKAWDEAVNCVEEYAIEHRIQEKDERFRWYLSRAVAQKNESGEIVKWFGTATDIHGQKTFAEKLEKEVTERTRELQNSQTFLQQLIDSSVEYISVLDKDLCFVTVNKRFEDAMHTSRRDVEGKSLFDFNPKIKNTRQHEGLVKALEGEVVHFEKENSITRPDLFVDTYFIPYRQDGTVQGVISMSRDISSIVRTEKLLEQTNKELQRSNEDLQQFAHVASHDLKEPVRKVRTFISRLVHEFGAQLPEKAMGYIDRIQSASDRMYSMIDGVLLYSSTNALEQQTEAVNLHTLLREIENDLEVLMRQKNATIITKNLPVITALPVLIYQLFYNMVNNSLKFTKPDVAPLIKVTATEPLPEELENAELKDGRDYVKILIEDNGIGFNSSDAGRIFGTFARLHPKDRYEGTGLGLALCKKIVERHGGAIWAEGKEGEGASFHLLLPRNV